MAQEIKDQAVCIGRQNYSETSQIVTLFTHQHGKVRAMAKGARREKGRYGGGIDLLSVGNVIFLLSRTESGLSNLVEFDPMVDMGQLRHSLIGLHCAEYAASLLADFTEELDPHENLFLTFLESLRAWQNGDGAEKTLVRFELQLFTEVGLAPVWDRCTVCRGDLEGGQRLYFNTRQGGMVCSRCVSKISYCRPVGREALVVLRAAEPCESSGVSGYILAHELLANYAVELLGRKKPIVEFLNRLLKQSGR